MRFLFGINFGLRFNTRICKKLLRFRTGLSATAVVAPVNFFGHLCSISSNCKSTFDNAMRNTSNTPDTIVKHG